MSLLAQNNSKSSTDSDGDGVAKKPTTFHDFLGKNGGQESAVGGGWPLPEMSPSTTSERNHLEGIPFYASRGDKTRAETGSRFTGNKRSNSDSFIMSSRDGLSQEDNHPILTKLLHYSGLRKSHDNGPAFGVHQSISQSSAVGRTNCKTFLQDNANAGFMSSRYPRVMPLVYQAHSNRFRDTNAATDERSRTGVLSSADARQPQKRAVVIPEPESTTAPCSQRSGDQMTIFYRGKAHVFDNVHPSKADVIMALARSNGGSWSTTCAPKPTGNLRLPCSDNGTSITAVKGIERPRGDC